MVTSPLVILYFHSDCDFWDTNLKLVDLRRMNKDDVANLPQVVLDEVVLYPFDTFVLAFNSGEISDEGRIAFLTIEECKEIGVM